MAAPVGFLIHIDDIGRVVIPAGIRRQLGIGPGDELEAFACEDGVFLRVASGDVPDRIDPVSIFLAVSQSTPRLTQRKP